ncbi:MAG: hypothetical protein ACE5R6_08790 [Candidatus Heimdallarchaeota archaeon]
MQFKMATGKEWIYIFGEWIGPLVAAVHNAFFPATPWQKDMNALYCTGNRAIDTLIGTVVGVVGTFALMAAIAVPAGLVARLVFQTGASAAMGAAKAAAGLTLRQMIVSALISELLEEVLLDTLPGVILYKIGDELDSVTLQRIGDFVGQLPISLGINLDINLGKLNRGQRVKIGGIAMRLSVYHKILRGIDPNGFDLARKIGVGRQVEFTHGIKHKGGDQWVDHAMFDAASGAPLAQFRMYSEASLRTRLGWIAPSLCMDLAWLLLYSYPAFDYAQ